jgi:hypothetical protein
MLARNALNCSYDNRFLACRKNSLPSTRGVRVGMEPWLGGEFGAVVDWLVGCEDGRGIRCVSLPDMVRRGEPLADSCRGDPVGVRWGVNRGVKECVERDVG